MQSLSASLAPARVCAGSNARLASRSRAQTVVVRAEGQVRLPAGVSEPKKQPNLTNPKFGFVYNAERLNSRAAMIGFFALLLLEGVANKGILEMMGVVVGKGVETTL